MFNVLPNNLKKLIVNEYHLRVVIGFCICFICIMLCTVVFLLPSWLLGSIKQKTMADRVAMLEQAPTTGHTTTVSRTITSTNILLHSINTSFAYPPAKPLLDAILSGRGTGIRLSEFSYSVDDATHSSLVLQGVSNTRNALVSYVKSLQNSGLFTSVDLPVSDLAKDTDITFTLNLSVGTPLPASSPQTND